MDNEQRDDALIAAGMVLPPHMRCPHQVGKVCLMKSLQAERIARAAGHRALTTVTYRPSLTASLTGSP